jgi:hypothetical protein
VDTTKAGAASLICLSYFGGSGGDDKVQALAYDAVIGSATYRLIMAGQTTSMNFPLLTPLQSTLTGAQNGWVSTASPWTDSFLPFIGGNAPFGLAALRTEVCPRLGAMPRFPAAETPSHITEPRLTGEPLHLRQQRN